MQSLAFKEIFCFQKRILERLCVGLYVKIKIIIADDFY